jgi:hypothetical protein
MDRIDPFDEMGRLQDAAADPTRSHADRLEAAVTAAAIERGEGLSGEVLFRKTADDPETIVIVRPAEERIARIKSDIEADRLAVVELARDEPWARIGRWMQRRVAGLVGDDGVSPRLEGAMERVGFDPKPFGAALHDSKLWRLLPPWAQGQLHRWRREYRQAMQADIGMAAEYVAARASPNLAWNVFDKMVRARKVRQSTRASERRRPSYTGLMEAVGALSGVHFKTAPKRINKVLFDPEFRTEAEAKSRELLADNILERANVVLRQCPNPRQFDEGTDTSGTHFKHKSDVADLGVADGFDQVDCGRRVSAKPRYE